MRVILTIFLSVLGLSSMAQGVIAPGTGTPGVVPGGNGIPGLIAGGPKLTPGTPTLTVSPTTLTGFSTTQGTASASQNYTITFANLTGNIIVNAPSSFEISLDNASFSSSLTISTITSPLIMYVRIAASATAGTPSGNITNATTEVSTKNVSVSGTVTAATSAFFNFSGGSAALGTIGGNFWNNFNSGGSSTNPGTTSVTDASTGWKVQSNGSGTWNAFGGFYGGVGNGATGSTDATFTAAVISSGALFNYDVTFSGTYQFSVTSLATGTYTLKFACSVNTTNFTDGGNMSVHIKVGTGSDAVAIPSGFSPNNNNTISSISITVTSGQTVQIAICTNATGANNLGWINAMQITKTS